MNRPGARLRLWHTGLGTEARPIQYLSDARIQELAEIAVELALFDGDRLSLFAQLDEVYGSLPVNMKFQVTESGEEFSSRTKPIVIVTSNAERNLPGAFLRRCVFFHIPFPDHALLVRILTERLGGEGGDSGLSAMAEPAVSAFEGLRERLDWKKKPATGELLKWTQVLLRSGADPAALAKPRWSELFPWALAKTREDLQQVMDAG